VHAASNCVAMPTPVVLLHGFAATARHWDRVIAALPDGRFAPVALTLTDAEPLTPDGVTELVAASAAGHFTLVGYSMGGRLALHAALAIPERISQLVLISTSAGIEDARERAARKAADDELATEIEQGSIASFVVRWRALPLFAHDPDWIVEEVADDERRCDPVELAAMLRGLGVGAMDPMWDRLAELAMPVAILSGELDVAYESVGRRIAASTNNSTFRLVPGVGHRVGLQAPGEVVRALCGAS
jgi:2-succinyl-6-hydroxy-2,4-cyclohexadiene-1-carboxylate synthase